MLCGKERCPLLVRYYASQKFQQMTASTQINGSSPPGVFVGRFGYPKVFVGPLIPPIHGDTSELDLPELWLGKSIDEIVEMRSLLVRGMHPVKVNAVYRRDKLLEATQEVALARESPEMETHFWKKPRGKLVLDDEVQPQGPSAPLKSVRLGTLKIDAKLDKASSDTDFKAKDAVLWLYNEGVEVSRIQRLLSIGLLGLGRRRRLVPTRWSITAVDSSIGEVLMEKVKRSRIINEYRIYESWELDNRFEVLMMPTRWQYELIEAWYPNTIWNPMGKRVMMISSHEGWEGRKEYAEIGGCYYAARLAVCEHLVKENRQAGVVILREAHPGYIMPVGVWNVRENVRAALRKEPKKFNTLKEALEYLSMRLEIGMKRWISQSAVLHSTLYQRRLEDFAD